MPPPRDPRRDHSPHYLGDAVPEYVCPGLETAEQSSLGMQEMKDTARAMVRIGYDGRVYKTYRGIRAKERFDHEIRVLKHLEARGCTFVPQVLEAEPEVLRLVTTNCGGRVDHLNPERQKAIFAELEQFGVRHEDPALRNITYRTTDGRFCIIDFEFATLLDDAGNVIATLKPNLEA